MRTSQEQGTEFVAITMPGESDDSPTPVKSAIETPLRRARVDGEEDGEVGGSRDDSRRER